MKAFGDQRFFESAASDAAPAFAFITAWLRSARRNILFLYERQRQRQALLALDERMLKDIGVGAADAWKEGHLPFWRDSDWRPGP